MSYFEKTQILAADSPSIDAFGKWRVSNPTTLFDSKQIVDSGSFYFDIKTVGSATVTWNSGSAQSTFRVTQTSGSRAIKQTKRIFVYQPGKCVAQNEYIILADGSRLKAKELVGKEFYLMTNVSGSLNKCVARANWNLFEPIFKITTKSGRTIVRNAKHPLWMMEKQYKNDLYKKGTPPITNVIGWQPLEHIKTGSYVAVTDYLPIFGNNYLTADDCKLIGYLIGDGGIVRGVTFTQMDNKQLSEFKELANNYECDMIVAKTNPYTFRVVSREGTVKRSNNIINLCRKLNIYGKRGFEKNIPNEIFESSKENISLFLSRLYSTDGWASKCEIGYGSTSLQLILDIQELLIKFGIRSVVSKKINRHPDKHKQSYSLFIFSKDSIQKFASEIGIFGKEIAVENVVNNVKNKKTSYKELFKSKNINDGLFWDEVVSVECIGNDLTVAIEVDKYHTYLTSFYEHNSQQIICTGKFGTGVDGIKKNIGSFDDNDGFFFQSSGSSFGIVLRKTINRVKTDTFVSQSSWNLDKMNGVGPSGNILDINKAQIYTVDYEWLGVGRVRYGVVQKGILIYVHEINNYNSLETVYLRNPNLPIRYEMSTHKNTTTGSLMTQICSTVISEGGFDNTGRRMVVTNPTGATIGSSDYDAVLFIRYNIVNTECAQIIPEELNFLVEPGNNSPFSGRWDLLVNPTVTDPVVWNNVTGSVVTQMARSSVGNAITNPGTVIATGYFSGTGGAGIDSQITIDPYYGLGKTINKVSDVLALGIKAYNNTYTIYPTIVVRELT